MVDIMWIESHRRTQEAVGEGMEAPGPAGSAGTGFWGTWCQNRLESRPTR